MARTRRQPSELSAYERRIASYLRRHPGASRQQARGHKPSRARASEYKRRVRAARKRYPRIPRQWAAGHGRQVLAFLNYIRPGDLVMLANPVGLIERDAKGRIKPFEKRVVPADDERGERIFRLPRMTAAQLRWLIRTELDRGADLTYAPSLDQRNLLARKEQP